MAFADDLILVTRGKTVIEAENFTNTELTKVTAWAKNKVEFNDDKSTAMLVSRRKRKERKH